MVAAGQRDQDVVSTLLPPFNKNSVDIFSEMFEKVIIYGSIGNAYERQVTLLKGTFKMEYIVA